MKRLIASVVVSLVVLGAGCGESDNNGTDNNGANNGGNNGANNGGNNGGSSNNGGATNNGTGTNGGSNNGGATNNGAINNGGGDDTRIVCLATDGFCTDALYPVSDLNDPQAFRDACTDEGYSLVTDCPVADCVGTCTTVFENNPAVSSVKQYYYSSDYTAQTVEAVCPDGATFNATCN